MMSELQNMQQKPKTKLRTVLKTKKAKTCKPSELSKTKIVKQPVQQPGKPAQRMQFELLSNPSLLKSRYPIDKPANERLKIAH